MLADQVEDTVLAAARQVLTADVRQEVLAEVDVVPVAEVVAATAAGAVLAEVADIAKNEGIFFIVSFVF